MLIFGFGYMDYTFDFSWLGEYLPMIWQGALFTLALTLASALIGGLLGTLGAIGMRYGGKALRGVLVGYVEFIRNTPFARLYHPTPRRATKRTPVSRRSLTPRSSSR